MYSKNNTNKENMKFTSYSLKLVNLVIYGYLDRSTIKLKSEDWDNLTNLHR